MLDQIIKLVQQNAGNEILQNSAIPAQHKNEAIKLVGSEIVNGLQSQAKQGNIQGLTSLLNLGNTSSLASNPMVTQIISSVAEKLATKFGLPKQVTQQVATTLIPKVVSQFITKTKDPKDNDFDLQDVMKSFTGNSNVGDMLGKIGGDSGLGGALGGLFK